MTYRSGPGRRPLIYSPKPKVKAKPARGWRLLRILWEAIKRTCMLIGAVILVSAVVGMWLTSRYLEDTRAQLPEEMVLYLKAEGNIVERKAPDLFGYPLGPGQLAVADVVDAIDYAGADNRVKELVVNLKAGMPLAHMQEIRQAVKRFRDKGKTARIYADSYGSYGSALGQYYLASAFDEIWMQPMGTLSITGISFEAPYLKKALNALGIKAEFFKRKKYKTAAEALTREDMSPEQREILTALIRGFSSQITAGISQERGIDEVALGGLIDRGLLNDHEALDAGLIDRLDYGDVIVEEVTKVITGNKDSKVPFVRVRNYLGFVDRARKQALMVPPVEAVATRVALVQVNGTIVPSQQGGAMTSAYGGAVAAADKLSKAIYAAADNDAYGAIVLRVNSPGGSPTASETIRRAVVYAKEQGKEVVVSMGPYAASGGYWVSADADTIFALPTTITGSIGVVGGKFDLSGLWDKINVNWDRVEYGENAGLWSFNQPFTPKEQERFESMLDSVYDGFISRVAQGRNMPREAVEKVAQGRPWSGLGAAKVGLVDQLGGLRAALDHTARELGGQSRDDLIIDILPRPKTLPERILEQLYRQAALGEFVYENRGVTEFLAPLSEMKARQSHPEHFMVREDLAWD